MLGALRRIEGGATIGSEPQAVAAVVGPELGLPLVAGLVARSVARRFPGGGPVLRAALAAGVTVGLGKAARLVASR